MKKTRRRRARRELRDEYDFSKGVRGKHAGRIARKATIVVLEPDVSRHFTTSASVNAALRSLTATARPKRKPKRTRRGSPPADPPKRARTRSAGS